MDKSEKYIKMFEQAQEIQQYFQDKNWTYFSEEEPLYKKGRVFCWPNLDSEIGHLFLEEDKDFYLCKKNLTISKKEEIVWLPRQDQLQDMINNIPSSQGYFEFRMFIERNGFYIKDSLQTSWEKVWLAFVMQEKYNKIWNEEKQEWNTKN